MRGYGILYILSSNKQAEVMGLLAWVAFGLLAAVVAKFINHRFYPGGLMSAMMVGMVGAIMGGWTAMTIGWGNVEVFHIYGFLLAMSCSVVMLFIFSKLKGKNLAEFDAEQ